MTCASGHSAPSNPPPLGHNGPPLRGDLSLVHNPSVVRFASYVTGEYLPPASATIALFLPCSAEKPYSNSRTHRAVGRALSTLPRAIYSSIHCLTVSEPLGIVPCELEALYPAAHYDLALPCWFDANGNGNRQISTRRKAGARASTTGKRSLRLNEKNDLVAIGDRVAAFLLGPGRRYVAYVGYLRGTQREIMERAATAAKVTVDYPVDRLRREAPQVLVGTRWAFNGLRLPETLKHLEGALRSASGAGEDVQGLRASPPLGPHP